MTRPTDGADMFHSGAHKTGATALQHELGEARDDPRRLGGRIPGKSDDRYPTAIAVQYQSFGWGEDSHKPDPRLGSEPAPDPRLHSERGSS
jgi:hypothetical protein